LLKNCEGSTKTPSKEQHPSIEKRTGGRGGRRTKKGSQKEKSPRQCWLAVGPVWKYQARREGLRRRCDQLLRQTAEKRREGALMSINGGGRL